MFDVGFAEIFLLSVIGLLVLGPERLPAVARTLGGFMRKARSSWYTLKRTIESELAAADAAEPLQEARQELQEAREELQEISRQITDLDQQDPPAGNDDAEESEAP